MKWSGLVLLTFSIIWLSCSQKEVSIPDIIVPSNHALIKKSENGLLLYDGQPFSGTLRFTSKEGSLSETKQYHVGRQEGLYLGYYSTGEVRFKRLYHQGKKHGLHEGWYRDGSKKFRYYFENGLSEGQHLEWYRSGQLSREANYKEGHEFGTQKIWRSDGKIRTNYVIREDGRKYGLIGMKRCKNIDVENEQLDPITKSTL